MNELTGEEGMINDGVISRIFSGYFRVPMKVRSGTHPEMLHTFLELDKRRDRRVTPSDAKRKREIDLAVDVRQADEDTFGLAGRYAFFFPYFLFSDPDALQKTLVTESSRKRWRIECERPASIVYRNRSSS